MHVIRTKDSGTAFNFAQALGAGEEFLILKNLFGGWQHPDDKKKVSDSPGDRIQNG